MSSLRVALAQYPILRPDSLQGWRNSMADWVGSAAGEGAKLLAFPEYGSFDMTGLLTDAQLKTANGMIEAMQPLHAPLTEMLTGLAKRHNILIVGPSFPLRDGGKYLNRAHVFGPAGIAGYQDKLILTRFEREKTFLSPGTGMTVFETMFGRMAIAICFDAQFPLLMHRLVEEGVQLLVVPSCTGRAAGYNRVRIACQARALEAQFTVAQTPTVADAPWNPIADTNYGAGGVFVPPDNGQPEHGILALGTANQPGWVYANLDLKAVEALREDGHVLNWRCWGEQMAVPSMAVNHTKLF